MTKLERIERGILIFLVAALIAALTVSALRKSRQPARVSIEKFDIEGYKSAPDDDGSLLRKIDINSAGVEELMKIKGVGVAIAARIVEYRDRNGSFATIDAIKNVKGVGVALFEKIKRRIAAE